MVGANQRKIIKLSKKFIKMRKKGKNCQTIIYPHYLPIINSFLPPLQKVWKRIPRLYAYAHLWRKRKRINKMKMWWMSKWMMHDVEMLDNTVSYSIKYMCVCVKVFCVCQCVQKEKWKRKSAKPYITIIIFNDVCMYLTDYSITQGLQLRKWWWLNRLPSEYSAITSCSLLLSSFSRSFKRCKFLF